jgi:phospholipase C
MNITAANRALCLLDWIAAVILIFATCTISFAGVQAADLVNFVGGPVVQKPGQIATQTPIKHLIVVVGENHSFDNVFATYVSPDPKQQVWNLLSRGIVSQSGGPGPNFARAMQNKATDTTGYSLSPTQTGAFRDLPQPNTTLNAFPAPPCVVSRFLTERGENPSGIQFCSDPGLAASSQGLLSTGGTGQSFYAPELEPTVLPVPDCRYSSTLEDGPFPLVAASSLNECGPPFLDLVPAIVPTRFSDNTGDPVHRFFQMWQQNDCTGANTTEENPSGCNHDLYAWVATSVGLQITKDQKPPTDDQGTFQGGIAMGFYNMATGDFPFFQSLAQNFAINDNYHQFAMGGSGINSQSIGTADVYYATDVDGNPVSPAADLIEDPDPQIDSNNFYKNTSPGDGTGHGDLENTSTGGFVNCSDPTQKGVAPIQTYLNSLPYKLSRRRIIRRCRSTTATALPMFSTRSTTSTPVTITWEIPHGPAMNFLRAPSSPLVRKPFQP